MFPTIHNLEAATQARIEDRCREALQFRLVQQIHTAQPRQRPTSGRWHISLASLALALRSSLQIARRSL